MNQAIELQVPTEIYERAEQIAKESNRSVEKVLLEGLSLLFGTSEQDEIKSQDLQAYTDERLWAIVYQRLVWPHEARLRELLALGKAGQLAEAEKKELDALIRRVDHLTLIRSTAMLLLKQRGYDVEARLNSGA
jgi:hypothetical protein